jgi:hypothetical protein
MIERTVPANPRIRAGSRPQPVWESPRHWMQDRAPSLRTLARERRRREQVWAWLSLVVLIVCWDVSSRMEEPTSPPRSKVAQAIAEDEIFESTARLTVNL